MMATTKAGAHGQQADHDGALMTRGEQDLLTRHLNREEKTAKTRSEQQRARLEELLAATYDADLECWTAIVQQADQHIKKANEQILAMCAEMGVPKRFAPGLHLGWYDRGENASKVRRVGEARIAAREQQEIAAIEEHTVEVSRQIVAGALSSPQAKALIAAMPTTDALLPEIDIKELEAELEMEPQPRHRYLPYGL